MYYPIWIVTVTNFNRGYQQQIEVRAPNRFRAEAIAETRLEPDDEISAIRRKN